MHYPDHIIDHYRHGITENGYHAARAEQANLGATTMETHAVDMTVEGLIEKVNATGSKFFNEESMAFFGDTIENYELSAETTIVHTWTGFYECYELCRKAPVKEGLKASAYFDVDSFRKRSPKLDT